MYTNVGTYNGRSIDLKITVTNWTPYFTGDKVISFGRDAINHTQTGYTGVTQTWQYIDSETKKDVNVDGSYMKFVDMDGKQFITFDKETTNKIDKIYVSDDSWLDATQNPDGSLKVADIGDVGSVDTDPFAQFTTLFTGGKMTFTWGKDYEAAGYNKNQSAAKGLAGNEYFAYSDQKPVRTETLKPTKLVNDKDEKDKTENTLDAVQEAYNYTISHTVPNESEDFYYKSYVYEDTLVAPLELTSIKVTNELGKDVTSFFKNETEGNKVKLSATEEALSSADFYGHNYFYSMNVKVKDGANLDDFKDDNGTIHF
ncbi:isopeptide-forming domain-containing fimbrial protein [Listeria aquatica]|uniref:isopeptide-forming domain-containing fimbrial protein n=1 Tax=Listeria aquatica TaxID=1494960 RepID=UPI00131EF434|nr:isopeptide-forming domain-containing fimbrial protein [Listeria aquatica]